MNQLITHAVSTLNDLTHDFTTDRMLFANGIDGIANLTAAL